MALYFTTNLSPIYENQLKLHQLLTTGSLRRLAMLFALQKAQFGRIGYL